jgi:hypothetical protein
VATENVLIGGVEQPPISAGHQELWEANHDEKFKRNITETANTSCGGNWCGGNIKPSHGIVRFQTIWVSIAECEL